MQGIQNVIFDLGGVIINLDYKKTISEFNYLGKGNFEGIYSQSSQIDLFNMFDKGKISEKEFFSELKIRIGYVGPSHDMIKAWNAMLLDVPEHRLDVLVEMKHNYNTFLLSNTCETHVTAFEASLYAEHGIKNFNNYFDKVYYSCRLGMRKPDKEIFEFVLDENNLRPEETVFIDDSPQHVKGAGECGINAFLLEKDRELKLLLKDLKLL